MKVEISESDWKAIKEKFESGIYSCREIARQYGVRDKRINTRAEKEGWIRAFAYPSIRVARATKRKEQEIEENREPEPEWPRHTLPEVPDPVEQLNFTPSLDHFHSAVRSVLDAKKEAPTELPTPECGPSIPHPFMEESLDPAIYTERYQAIRLELMRKRKLSASNRLDEDTLVKLIDRVGALDTEGAIEELVVARMQINADTLARSAELKAIRDRYYSLVCDILGNDPGKVAAAAALLLASKNDSLQGAIKMVGDIDKLITDAERKAFDMDKPLKIKAQPKGKKEEKDFDIANLSTEQLAAIQNLARTLDPRVGKELPLPPTGGVDEEID